jgi:hypothetical protein
MSAGRDARHLLREPFGEDVAPITTIIKHLKRVMAGEYGRELSVRLFDKGTGLWSAT